MLVISPLLLLVSYNDKLVLVDPTYHSCEWCCLKTPILLSLGVLLLLVGVIDARIISLQGTIYMQMFRREKREKMLVNHIEIDNLYEKYDGHCIFEGLCHLHTKDLIQTH